MSRGKRNSVLKEGWKKFIEKMSKPQQNKKEEKKEEKKNQLEEKEEKKSLKQEEKKEEKKEQLHLSNEEMLANEFVSNLKKHGIILVLDFDGTILGIHSWSRFKKDNAVSDAIESKDDDSVSKESIKNWFADYNLFKCILKECEKQQVETYIYTFQYKSNVAAILKQAGIKYENDHIYGNNETTSDKLSDIQKIDTKGKKILYLDDSEPSKYNHEINESLGKAIIYDKVIYFGGGNDDILPSISHFNEVSVAIPGCGLTFSTIKKISDEIAESIDKINEKLAEVREREEKKAKEKAEREAREKAAEEETDEEEIDEEEIDEEEIDKEENKEEKKEEKKEENKPLTKVAKSSALPLNNDIDRSNPQNSNLM